jgi:hypothetical protein
MPISFKIRAAITPKRHLLRRDEKRHDPHLNPKEQLRSEVIHTHLMARPTGLRLHAPTSEYKSSVTEARGDNSSARGRPQTERAVMFRAVECPDLAQGGLRPFGRFRIEASFAAESRPTSTIDVRKAKPEGQLRLRSISSE